MVLFPNLIEKKIKSYRWESQLADLLSSCDPKGESRIVESSEYAALFRTEWVADCMCDVNERCQECVEDYICTFYRRGDWDQLIEIFRIERAIDAEEYVETTFGVEFLNDTTFIISTKDEHIDVCRIEGDNYRILNSIYLCGEIINVIRPNDPRYFLVEYYIRGFGYQGLRLFDVDKFINNDNDCHVKLWVGKNMKEEIVITPDGITFLQANRNYSCDDLFKSIETIHVTIYSSQ